LTFNKCKTRNAALWRKRIEIATFLLIAAGQVGHLSDWLMGVIWAFPHSFTNTFKNNPGNFQ
jgi:hypothetical protein